MLGRERNEVADDAPFWKQRSWVYSAVFLGTALVMATFSYLTGADNGRADAATPVPKAVKGPLSPGAEGDDPLPPGKRPHGCRTEDQDMKDADEEGKQEKKGEEPGEEKPGNGLSSARPTAAPEDVVWKNLDGMHVPTSPSVGPTRFDGPVWWCYAHTPMGAVMAAHGVLTHMGTDDWRTVAEQQIVPGEGRDSFISQRSGLGPDLDREDAGVYSGFLVGSYTRDRVQVRLLIKGVGGGLGATTVTMRWSGGDWKVEPQSDGTLYSASESTVSSGGFVRWGAA
ncbi:hypothetical protein [Streptomyces qinglanensis]|uniref:DUF8175 domain-containing protein n=1 Tax=Streptomyces qinglanensis TaxID=943816 RepID=A0A1H9SBM9_9ACTN|nr:hypothetical protein [Streptomyces qinglanensis]SER82371.1 hypothetical protein SAMN05421870_104421 [Streptomyces qinglanensis]